MIGRLSIIPRLPLAQLKKRIANQGAVPQASQQKSAANTGNERQGKVIDVRVQCSRLFAFLLHSSAVQAAPFQAAQRRKDITALAIAAASRIDASGIPPSLFLTSTRSPSAASSLFSITFLPQRHQNILPESIFCMYERMRNF